jgi:hypothetical protein
MRPLSSTVLTLYFKVIIPLVFVLGGIMGMVQIYSQTNEPIAFLFVLFLVPAFLFATSGIRRITYDRTKIVVSDFRRREMIKLSDIK